MKTIITFLSIVGLCFSSMGFAEETSTKMAKLKIDGMTCGVCAAKIKKNLTPLCKEASIDYKTGAGSCTYEEGKATPEQIVKAIIDAGFKGSIVQ